MEAEGSLTAFTSVRQLSLSWASFIQSMPPHPTSWRSILILSSHSQFRKLICKCYAAPAEVNRQALMTVSALRNWKDVSVHFSKYYSGIRLKGLRKSMETLSGDFLSVASERTWLAPTHFASICYTATYSMCYSYSNVINKTLFQIKNHLFCTGRKVVYGFCIIMEWTEDSINVKHKNKKLIIWIKTTAGAYMRRRPDMSLFENDARI